MDATLLVSFVIGLIVMLVLRRRSKSKLPPSRLTIPYIGTPTLIAKLPGTRPHEVFVEEAKTLGDVFSFSVGKRLLVVLNGFDAIHEALVVKASACSGRLEDLNRLVNIKGNECGKLYSCCCLFYVRIRTL